MESLIKIVYYYSLGMLANYMAIRVGLDYGLNLGSINWIPPLCQLSAGI